MVPLGDAMHRTPITGIAGCCARRERPCRCAAEQRNELAAPHGAHPKAKDRGLTIAGLARVGGVRRNKKWRPISANGMVRPCSGPASKRSW
jgi:hypothetical protein